MDAVFKLSQMPHWTTVRVSPWSQRMGRQAIDSPKDTEK
jgi:hypothetical protein